MNLVWVDPKMLELLKALLLRYVGALVLDYDSNMANLIFQSIGSRQLYILVSKCICIHWNYNIRMRENVQNSTKA